MFNAEPDDLLFLPLGGAGEIGMNLNLYGIAGKWLMVDLGITFAGDAHPGVDLITPDPTFIAERKDDLLGLVLTHDHEDHLGAVPYLWDRLQCPVWATPFTATVLRYKLQEVGLLDEVHTGRAAAAAAARQAVERLQAVPPHLLRTCWTALPAPSADAALVAMGSLQPLAPRQRGGARLVRLRVDDEGLVATLELADPARFNTMSAELGADLASHCSQRPLS